MKPSPAVLVGDEHDLYPVHEEDSVPQGDAHFWQTHYLTGVLKAHWPEMWVVGDQCLYWERGNTNLYVASDVAVISGPRPITPSNVYLAWSDPPLLFVGEIASESTRQADAGRKLRTYERLLQVPEYLYADPTKGDLRLWRMVDGRYRLFSPEANGRVWSAQLEVWFGYDETGFLRVYSAGGEMLLTHAEERCRAEDAERRLAELQAELERSRERGR